MSGERRFDRVFRAGPRSPRLWHRLVFGALVGVLASVPLTLLALSARAGWAPLWRLDQGVARVLHDNVVGREPIVDLLDVLAIVLSPTAFRLAVAVLIVVLLRRRLRRIAWWAAITMATGSVLSPTLKLLVARARPDLTAPVGTAPGFSFPSGHALNSAVGVLIFLLIVGPACRTPAARRVAWLIGGLVVLVTGLDRLALGVHFVSDVVAGWIVAVALVIATASAFETWRQPPTAVRRTPAEPRSLVRTSAGGS